MAERGYQHDFSSLHPERMYNPGERSIKAKKVIAILSDCLGPLSGLDHLDLGCSTGYMTRLYSASFRKSVGVDIDRKAVEHASATNSGPNLTYRVGDAMATGLPDASFDVITCSHVYEHVPDAGRLMNEIYRLLKPGGACFFAAGNRLILIEGHYGLPLLSVVPKWLAHPYIRLTGKAQSYYETHLTYWSLKKLVEPFELIDYTRKVIADPERFSATDLLKPGSPQQKAGLLLSTVAYWLLPTFLWVLRKPASQA